MCVCVRNFTVWGDCQRESTSVPGQGLEVFPRFSVLILSKDLFLIGQETTLSGMSISLMGISLIRIFFFNSK